MLSNIKIHFTLYKVTCIFHQGLLLYQKTTRNSYLEKMDGPARAPNNMDRFERCFSIFKLQASAESCTSNSTASFQDVSTGSETERHSDQHSEASDWRAVRVDLVVSPYSQFAFATLGWTGSKVCSFLTSKRFFFYFCFVLFGFSKIKIIQDSFHVHLLCSV